MWVLSAPGDVGGGFGVLSVWPCAILVAIWSLVVIALALRNALPPDETVAMMASMESGSRAALRHAA
jgi:hypothetical protein